MPLLGFYVFSPRSSRTAALTGRRHGGSLMADHHGGDDERGDDDVENVTSRSPGARSGLGSARSKIHLASAGHTCIEKRPALPTFEFPFARLFLAIGPFCLIFGPFLLRRLPLRGCPGLDLGRSGGLRRIRGGRWGR